MKRKRNWRLIVKLKGHQWREQKLSLIYKIILGDSLANVFSEQQQKRLQYRVLLNTKREIQK